MEIIRFHDLSFLSLQYIVLERDFCGLALSSCTLIPSIYVLIPSQMIHGYHQRRRYYAMQQCVDAFIQSLVHDADERKRA
jgi:hypothetical protein